MNGRLLIIPDKPDVERDALADCWIKQGGDVLRIDKFWIKPDVGEKAFSLYGFDMFCLILAQITKTTLITPDDDLLRRIQESSGKVWLKRALRVQELGDVVQEQLPCFIKSVVPKLFSAKVYSTVEELKEATEGLKSEEQLFVSEIIAVEKEVRVFVLDRTICDMAFYEGDGELEPALDFIMDFLSHCTTELPTTFVIDIGYNKADGWFIVEFNASWGAGLNGCDPAKVLPAIREATVSLK